MFWDETDMHFRNSLIELLRRKPYMELEDIHEELTRHGFVITATDLDCILNEEQSPFYPVPVRWAVDDRASVQLGDEQESALLEDPINEEATEYPELWIGPLLREWQAEAYNSWLSAGERGIIQAITGTGKTLVGVYAAASALDYGFKVAITVPTIDLMEQWIEQLTNCIDGVSIGRMGDGHQDALDEYDVIVSTIASGSRWYLRAEKAETLLIADEVHRMGSEKFQLALEEEATARLGLTATLERSNDTGVEDVILPYFGSVVYTYGYAEALSDGVLSAFRLGLVAAKFTPNEREEYEELGSEMGRLIGQLRSAGLVTGDGPELFSRVGQLARSDSIDFKQRRWAQRFVANLGKRRKIQASASDKFNAVAALSDAIALSERSLVFTETREAAQRIARQLQADSIEAFAFDASLDRQARSRMLDDYRRGDIQVLCAPRVLDEGVDIPEVDLGVIVSASQSRRQMIQRLGRIVRPNSHGRPSSLFITYLEGTREDPAEGGHEGFLDEVQPYASATRVFLSDTNPDLIADWVLD